MPMLTLLFGATGELPGGSSVTTVPYCAAEHWSVGVVATVSPWACRADVAAGGVSPMTLGTVTVGGAALHTPMVTLVPWRTDVPPGGFSVTTVPLSAVLQLLKVVGAAVSPAASRARV